MADKSAALFFTLSERVTFADMLIGYQCSSGGFEPLDFQPAI